MMFLEASSVSILRQRST